VADPTGTRAAITARADSAVEIKQWSSCRFSDDDELRKNGHFAAGEALQPASTAVTVHWKNRRVAATDGPYAETKEQLGGILVLKREI
jgi:hypothetical protein